MTYTDLPLVNACLNAACTALLLLGWNFIRAGRRDAHRSCMIGALCTSSAFLACYLYYHWRMQQDHGAAHTKFVDPAWFRPIYLAILFTHLDADGLGMAVPHGIAHAFLHDAVGGFLRPAIQFQAWCDVAFKADMGMALLPERDQVVNRGLQSEVQAIHGL